jgi:hypothetical protein
VAKRTCLFEVTVDGKQISAPKILFFIQSDPYPAGHRYWLQISVSNADKLFRSIGIGEYSQLDQRIVGEVMFVINNLISEQFSHDELPSSHDYFLNTIDQLNIGTEIVQVQGVCSEILKGPEK